MTRTTTRKTALAVAIALTTTATLAGCSGGGNSGTDSAAVDRDLSCSNTVKNEDAPQVLVWAWYPEFGQIVDAFNEEHDDVQVCWNNAGVGAEQYAKLNTAFTAGTGAPDVFMVGTSNLKEFLVTGHVVDLAEYGADDIADEYSDGLWSDVSSGGGVYSVPKDDGPVGLLYRQDLFDKYGIDVPTTWEEFADAAKAMKAAGYPGYFANMPPNGRIFIDSLFANAGAKPYGYSLDDPQAVTLNIDSPEVVDTLTYWNDLIQAGAVSFNDRATSEDNARLLNGDYASYIAAAWGPGYLTGLAEGQDTDAQWQAAPVPQWDADQPIEAVWGGSGFAVTDQAPDKALAAQVAMELLSGDAQWELGIEAASLFPALASVRDDESFADREYEFFGGQQINKDVFIPAAEGYQGFETTPFQTYVYDQWNDAIFKMANGELTPEQAAKQVDAASRDFAETQGYEVQ